MTGRRFERRGFIRTECSFDTRLVKERVRLGMVHNGSSGQTQRRITGGPKDWLEWPLSLHLCHYATLTTQYSVLTSKLHWLWTLLQYLENKHQSLCKSAMIVLLRQAGGRCPVTDDAIPPTLRMLELTASLLGSLRRRECRWRGSDPDPESKDRREDPELTSRDAWSSRAGNAVGEPRASQLWQPTVARGRMHLCEAAQQINGVVTV